jgi:hypothetical protein
MSSRESTVTSVARGLRSRRVLCWAHADAGGLSGRKNPAGLGTASLLLYLEVTFTIQRLVLQAQAQRIPGASSQNTGAPTASW